MIVAGKNYKKIIRTSLSYFIVILVMFILVYPVIWMTMGSFKTQTELFGGTSVLPKQWYWGGYIKAIRDGIGQNSLFLYMLNTCKLTFPTVLATIASSCLVGYGFTRFRFPLKKLMFMLVIATMLLPNAVTIIPRFIIFNKLKWVDTYHPFWVPNLFGASSFAIYMSIQFFRTVPIELDEAAKIDGCSSLGILIRVIMPLCKAMIFSNAVLQFLWSWNDYFNSLIFVTTARKYPLSIALRLALDNSGVTDWPKLLAMSVISVIPCVIVYAFLQQYFIEGIAAGSIKG